MKSIQRSYLINASVEEVFNALVTKKSIEAWTGSKATMENRVGSKFSLWGGDIYGVNKEINENQRLVQEWWYKGWENPSEVVIQLEKAEKGTRINFSHTGIPENDFDGISSGWDDYYFGAIKNLLEG